MKNNSSKKTGFTLVELMVVVAIISLLTGLISVNLVRARAKARDAKRVSDVGQLQLALELVFDRCNRYPQSDQGQISTDEVCLKNGASINIETFITTIPTPPLPTTLSHYGYKVNSDPATDYILAAVLEEDNEILSDDRDGTIYTIACDDNASPYVYCVGSN